MKKPVDADVLAAGLLADGIFGPGRQIGKLFGNLRSHAVLLIP